MTLFIAACGDDKAYPVPATDAEPITEKENVREVYWKYDIIFLNAAQARGIQIKKDLEAFVPTFHMDTSNFGNWRCTPGENKMDIFAKHFLSLTPIEREVSVMHWLGHCMMNKPESLNFGSLLYKNYLELVPYYELNRTEYWNELFGSAPK